METPPKIAELESPATNVPTNKPNNTGGAWSIWCLAIAILCIVGLLWHGSRSAKVQDYVRLRTTGMEQILNGPKEKNPFASRVESAHATVTYKEGHVKSWTVKTIDGSDQVGANGSNIAEETFVLTAHWDGFIQKNGFTDVEFVYDNRAHEMRSTRFVSSNAVFNWETVDWFAVGWVVGKSLGALAVGM